MHISWWVVFGASVAVYLAIGMGAATRWIGWLTEDADQSLLRLVVRVLYPCLIFSIVSNNEALRSASNVVLPPLVGFATMALGFAAAWLLSRLDQSVHGLDDARGRRTFAVCVGVYNYGFVPIPLVRMLFDDRTLGVLFVHNIGAELGVWTLGVMLLSGELGRRWWQRMFNAPCLTILAALIVNFLGLYRFLPQFAVTAVEWLGQAAIPMSLILIGAVIADELQVRQPDRTRADGARLIFWSLALRLLVLPIAFLAIAWALPCGVELKRVIVIMAAMPSGTFPIVMARHYGGDSGVGLRVALSTSLVSLLTIPLWVSGGMHLLGLAGHGG